MRRFLLAVAFLAVMVGAARADGVIRMAMIVESTVDDKGWCQSMHDGITARRRSSRGASSTATARR